VQLAAGQPTVAVSTPKTPDNVFRPTPIPNPPVPKTPTEEKEIILDSTVLNTCLGEAEEILINYVGPIQSVAGSGRNDAAVALTTASHVTTNPFYGGKMVASPITVKNPIMVGPLTMSASPNVNKPAPVDAGKAVTTAALSVAVKPQHGTGIGIASQRATSPAPKPTNMTNPGACSLPVIGQPVGEFNIRTYKSSPPRSFASNVLTPTKDPTNMPYQLGTAAGSANLASGLTSSGGTRAAAGDNNQASNCEATMAAVTADTNIDNNTDPSMLVVSSSFVQVHVPLLTPCVTCCPCLWHHARHA